MKSKICTVYKSNKEDQLYLFVEKSEGFEKVPNDLLSRMGKTSEVMTILINSEKKLARVESSKVLEQIELKGYYLQLPPVLYPVLAKSEDSIAKTEQASLIDNCES
jgi:uncharacterized protein